MPTSSLTVDASAPGYAAQVAVPSAATAAAVAAPPPGAPVSVLGRVMAVLGAFDESTMSLSLADLARRCALPKPTVHRLAAEMCAQQLLRREADGTYRLGLRLFELGALVPTNRTLSAAALPLMEDLREVTQGRIHLAILDGVDVVYVAILGTGGILAPSRTGGRLPAHATGVGKAILAYSPLSVVRARIEAGLPKLTPRTISTEPALIGELRKIRAVGMALDMEESTLGISCVAAPVYGADRKVRAALSVTGKTAHFDPGTLGPAVRTAAFTLSRELRTSGI